MTSQEKAYRWRRAFYSYMNKQTAYYEYLNAHAQTKTHKATPEETAYYMDLVNPKSDVHKLIYKREIDTMSKTAKILLTTIKDVQNFSECCSALPKNVSVTALHGKYIVDGKSMLGIMSLNLSDPIDLVIKDDNSGNYDEKIAEFFRKIKRWETE